MQNKGLRFLYTCLVLVLNIIFSECSSRARVDLSYKPHLGNDIENVATFIGNTIWGASTKLRQDIDIDLSSSLFGDDKMKIITQKLFPNVDTILEDCDPTKKIRLAARMNRLTPVGVSSLLDSICSRSATKKEKEKSKKNECATDTSNSTAPEVLARTHRRWYVHSLDLGWNDFHPETKGSKIFLAALRSTFEDSETCPSIICLENCSLGPAACRAIGKGIMTRYKSDGKEVPEEIKGSTSLFLCGNEGLGDSGAAALAAALRTVNSCGAIFDVLDLSWCDIGDAGAEAIAMALETNPGCIRHLDLSHNSITDEGVSAIAKALAQVSNGPSLQSLKFNGNKDIGDHGASEIAKVVGVGQLPELSLRCCHVHADGAKSFGLAIKAMSSKPSGVESVKIDLSGNPIGVLRKKSKGGVSASMLKSKASATTASYMNFIGKSIKSGLKDVGLDGVLGNAGPSAESDDDEEERMGLNGDSLANDGELTDPSKARCGAKSFASVFFDDGDDDNDASGNVKTSSEKSNVVRCELALRHCSLDQGAADALAAVVLRLKENLGIAMTVDVRMNTVLEETMVDALQDTSGEHGSLEEMADRHIEVMEALRVAEERAAEAAKAAAERASASRMGWDDEYDEFDFSHANDYDSDAAYDDDDDSYAY